MKLFREGILIDEDVTLDDALDELTHLATPGHASFTLDNSTQEDQQFMRVVGDLDEFALEYREGDDADHYTVSCLSLKDIKKAFTYYFNEDEQYRQIYNWRPFYPDAHYSRYERDKNALPDLSSQRAGCLCFVVLFFSVALLFIDYIIST